MAISPDKPEKLKRSIKNHKLTYTLLSDSPMLATKRFGIAFRLDDKTFAKYKIWRLDIEGASEETYHLLPVPSLYMIDPLGIIRYAYSNKNYKVRLQPEEVLEQAEKLK